MILFVIIFRSYTFPCVKILKMLIFEDLKRYLESKYMIENVNFHKILWKLYSWIFYLVIDQHLVALAVFHQIVYILMLWIVNCLYNELYFICLLSTMSLITILSIDFSFTIFIFTFSLISLFLCSYRPNNLRLVYTKKKKSLTILFW